MRNSEKKAVIVRTYSAGVHFGYLVSQNGKEVVLERTRRIWRWVGTKAVPVHTLTDIAVVGVGDGSKISRSSPGVTLTEAIEVLLCTPEATANLEAATWAD